MPRPLRSFFIAAVAFLPLLGPSLLFGVTGYTNGPVSIIVSTADRTGYMYRNGVQIGRAAIGGIDRLSGTHIYAALGTVGTDGKRNWISTASVGGRAPNLPDLANKVIIAPEFLSHARALIIPGTTLVLTDAPVSDRTRSAPGIQHPYYSDEIAVSLLSPPPQYTAC